MSEIKSLSVKSKLLCYKCGRASQVWVVHRGRKDRACVVCAVALLKSFYCGDMDFAEIIQADNTEVLDHISVLRNRDKGKYPIRREVGNAQCI